MGCGPCITPTPTESWPHHSQQSSIPWKWFILLFYAFMTVKEIPVWQRADFLSDQLPPAPLDCRVHVLPVTTGLLLQMRAQQCDRQPPRYEEKWQCLWASWTKGWTIEGLDSGHFVGHNNAFYVFSYKSVSLFLPWTTWLLSNSFIGGGGKWFCRHAVTLANFLCNFSVAASINAESRTCFYFLQWLQQWFYQLFQHCTVYNNTLCNLSCNALFEQPIRVLIILSSVLLSHSFTSCWQSHCTGNTPVRATAMLRF